MAVLGRSVTLALVFVLGQVAPASRVKFNIKNPQLGHTANAHSSIDQSEAKAVVSEHRQSTASTPLYTPKVRAATTELHSSKLHTNADQEEFGSALAETSSTLAHSEADLSRQQQAKVTSHAVSRDNSTMSHDANKSISDMGSMPAMASRALGHFRSMVDGHTLTAEFIVLSVVLAVFVCMCCICFTGFSASLDDSGSENGRNQYTSKNRVIYEWDQTPEILTMYTKPPPGITKHNIEVLLWAKHVSIGRKDKPAFLKEELYAEIDLEKSTYGISRAGELEIRFHKREGAQWPCVIKAHLGGKSRSAKTSSAPLPNPRKTTA